MTDREKAIIMAYTGICMLTGEKFEIFHKYIEEKCERPIWTHELAFDSVQKEIKEAVFEDFTALCADSQSWIDAKVALPPPHFEQYLVRVRSGGPDYGGWEYNTDLAWWGEYWDLNGSHGYDWKTILHDWDGDVQITHWMKIPDPPEV